MTKGSPANKKRLVSIKEARVVPSSTKGDLVTLGGKARNAVELNLAGKLVTDVNGVKRIKTLVTIE